jgi:hypothetical protein
VLFRRFRARLVAPDTCLDKTLGIPHDAVIRVYDEVGNVIETDEHAGDLENPQESSPIIPLDRLCSAYLLP